MLYRLSYARGTSESIQGRAAPQDYPTLKFVLPHERGGR